MAKGKGSDQAEKTLRDALGAPDIEQVKAVDVETVAAAKRIEQAAAFADFLAGIEPEVVAHYVYRLDPETKKGVAVGTIVDMPDEIPRANDYGERFITPGCYYCITEIKYYEDGKRKKFVKAGPREWVGPDYSARVAQQAAAAPVSAHAAARGGALDGTDDALGLAFKFFDRFTDVALKLRGEAPPPPPPVAPDVAALQAAFDASEKRWRRLLEDQERRHDEALARAQAAAPAPVAPERSPLDVFGGVDGTLDAIGKGAKLFGELKDAFAPRAAGGES